MTVERGQTLALFWGLSGRQSPLDLLMDSRCQGRECLESLLDIGLSN